MQYPYHLDSPSVIIVNRGREKSMPKFCPECANPIVENNMPFCPKCGANIGEANTDRQTRVIYNPQKNYSINYTLILLLILIVVCSFINGILGLLIVIISAFAVYYDAKSIGAGKSSQKEKMFQSMTYTPISWGLLTLVFWILGLPLYLYRREEIFNQNL